MVGFVPGTAHVGPFEHEPVLMTLPPELHHTQPTPPVVLAAMHDEHALYPLHTLLMSYAHLVATVTGASTACVGHEADVAIHDVNVPGAMYVIAAAQYLQPADDDTHA